MSDHAYHYLVCHENMPETCDICAAARRLGRYNPDNEPEWRYDRTVRKCPRDKVWKRKADSSTDEPEPPDCHRCGGGVFAYCMACGHDQFSRVNLD